MSLKCLESINGTQPLLNLTCHIASLHSGITSYRYCGRRYISWFIHGYQILVLYQLTFQTRRLGCYRSLSTLLLPLINHTIIVWYSILPIFYIASLLSYIGCILTSYILNVPSCHTLKTISPSFIYITLLHRSLNGLKQATRMSNFMPMSFAMITKKVVLEF